MNDLKLKNKGQIHIGEHSIPCYEAANEATEAVVPFVSVVMLTYNHSKYIGQSIEGVAAQKTKFPIELIIAEDCSTDPTRAVIAEYMTKYPQLIRVLTSHTNEGARRNSLRAENACRGQYIAYCEGDDYWHDEDKLQTQIEFLEENPEYGLVYTNADTYDITTGERTRMAIKQHPQRCDLDDPFIQQLVGAKIIWPLTVVARRGLIIEIAQNCPEIRDTSFAMGDTQRYLEIAKRSKIAYIDASTATRNLLVESTTRSRDIQKVAAFAKSNKRLTLHYLDKYPVPVEIDRGTREWVAKRGLYFAYRCRNQIDADSELKLLQGLGARIRLKYRIYHFGSGNIFCHVAARFALWLIPCLLPFRNVFKNIYGTAKSIPVPQSQADASHVR